MLVKPQTALNTGGITINQQKAWKTRNVHFEKEEHSGFLEDVPNTLTDKADTSDTTKTETFWKNIRKILEPYGVNIEDVT